MSLLPLSSHTNGEMAKFATSQKMFKTILSLVYSIPLACLQKLVFNLISIFKCPFKAGVETKSLNVYALKLLAV